jgi:hypothetical protein
VSKRDDIYALGTANVVTIPGLKGSATRAFLGTVFLLSRSKTPTKTFASAQDAAAWLAPKLGPTWVPEDVVELCRVSETTIGLERPQ